ncbi:MAG TPA: hydrogenase [Firmicutes bacterium]|nr:hydrogenase [Bacillota bacterium]
MSETGKNPLLPSVHTIREVRDETDVGDVKTFVVDGSFDYLPGQCAMVSVFGVGECMISITSSPDASARGRYLEFAVKKVGLVTEALHELEPGCKIGIRGPYGNHFPFEQWAGKKLLFIGGGIGLAPLRSLINHCIAHKEEYRYGPIEIVYGARSPGDLCFKDEIMGHWPKCEDTTVHLTVDRGDENWKGHVGFVPQFVEEIAPSPSDCVAITCGPPIMIKLVLETLRKLGFEDDQVITTLELKMQCGIGKCGRCNVGSKYVCKDGPVFSLAQLKQLPAEF